MATPRRPRARRRMPEQRFPDAAERRHIRELRRLAAILIADIRKELPALLRPFRADARREDAHTPTHRVSARFRKQVDSKATKTAIGRTARVAARFNESQIERQFKTATGRRLKTVPGRERAIVNAHIRSNVKLIKGMGTEELAKIRRVLRDGRRAGTSLEAMTGQISRRLNVIESRAKTIASDQMGKLNAALTESLHKANGADGYIWRTQEDADVRPAHADLNGTRQKYASPPVTNEAGDTNHPGEDINCRCRAEPQFEDAA